MIASYALFLLLYCLVCWFVFPLHLQADIEQQLASPDGRYTAVLSYQSPRENPIDGIYRVTLERSAVWCFRRPYEVSEVDTSEIHGGRALGIAWRTPQTLVVQYANSISEEAFAVRKAQWRGVRLVYQRQ